MKFRILSSQTVIGESDFEGLEPSMGIAQGVFVPGPGYKEVQPVFRLYAEAGTSMADQDEAKLSQYYRARDALGLSVVTAAGENIPIQCVHITDYSEEIGEIEVAVIVSDADTFRRILETGQ